MDIALMSFKRYWIKLDCIWQISVRITKSYANLKNSLILFLLNLFLKKKFCLKVDNEKLVLKKYEKIVLAIKTIF